MLAITNLPKFNEIYEICMKILQYPHKILVFGRVNDKIHTITATSNHV